MPSETVRYTQVNKNGEICWNKLVISNHAYKRARQRISWSRNALNRMTVLAYTCCIRRYQLKGKLKYFTNDLMFGYEKQSNIRIYGEVIYIFRHQTLVTLYQIPSDLRKCLVYQCKNENTNYEKFVIN